MRVNLSDRSDPKERLKGLDALKNFALKNRGQLYGRPGLNSTMNALIDCISEQNAKVAASSEETLISVMPEVREELEKNLATVIGSLSNNLVSNNALVRSNAS